MFLSEAFALASATCIALSSMALSELRGRVPVMQLARWQMLAAFAMTGMVSLALGGWRTVAWWQFELLAASSVAGIMVASTTYFAAIYSVGPRITALLFSLTSPFALVFGYVALGETIGVQQGLGVALVLSGIVLAVGAKHGRPGGDVVAAIQAASETAPLSVVNEPASVGPLWPGLGFGIVTALGQALGSLLARPAMAAGVEPFTGMAVRSGLAALFFVAFSVAIPSARGTRAALTRDNLALGIGAAFLGTTLGMSLLLAALHQGSVGVVSTLSSLTPVLVLPLVWIRSGHRPSVAAWLGSLLAIIGTAAIALR